MNATELQALADLATVLVYAFSAAGFISAMCFVFMRGRKS